MHINKYIFMKAFVKGSIKREHLMNSFHLNFNYENNQIMKIIFVILSLAQVFILGFLLVIMAGSICPPMTN